MSYFLSLAGGPCAGTYSTAYARAQLRAVLDPAGRADVLDAPQDEPAPGEEIFAYVADPRRGRGHVCFRGPTGCVSTITYRYLGRFVDGEVVDPLTQEESEELAEQWEREQARAYMNGDERAYLPPGHDPTPARKRERKKLNAAVAEAAGQTALW